VTTMQSVEVANGEHRRPCKPRFVDTIEGAHTPHFFFDAQVIVTISRLSIAMLQLQHQRRAGA
jgi:hypothetical protein